MRAIILASVFLLLGASPLFAQRGPEARQWKKMNLTSEQMTDLKNIRANTQKQMVDLRAALNKKRIDMRSLTDSETPDRAAFEGLSREIADLQVRQKMLLFDADQQVMKNLNAEQQKQWKTIKQGRMQKMEKGMRRFGKDMQRPDRDRDGDRGRDRGRDVDDDEDEDEDDD